MVRQPTAVPGVLGGGERLPSPPLAETPASHLADLVAEREWYHTLELAPGVVTRGWFDTRALPERIAFPDNLAGLRCLDVGTFDGYWAFEMERRGASEVVAIDILDPAEWDWPAGSDPSMIAAIGARKGRGEGFEIARNALGAKAQRIEQSVYDLDPDTNGRFDFVYLGSLLVHLRDPVGALKRVRSVCAGRLVLVEAIDVPHSLLHPRRPSAALDAAGRPWWWKPNLAGLRRMVEAAGFDVQRGPAPFLVPRGEGQPKPPLELSALRDRHRRAAATIAWVGDPHAFVHATPRD